MKFALKLSIIVGFSFLLGCALLCFTEFWFVGALGVVMNIVFLVLNFRKLRALNKQESGN
jgi:hypothetical protein